MLAWLPHHGGTAPVAGRRRLAGLVTGAVAVHGAGGSREAAGCGAARAAVR